MAVVVVEGLVEWCSGVELTTLTPMIAFDRMVDQCYGYQNAGGHLFPDK